MRKHFWKAAIGLALILVPASCGDKQLATIYDNQESNIEAISENLLNANEDATLERANGSVRITVVHGEGQPLEERGAVALYYAGYYISGRNLGSGNLFATNNESVANSARWAVTDTSSFDIVTLKLDDKDIVEGLRDGLLGVKGGDECYVLFSGKKGFGKKKIGNIPSNAALAYHLWIKSVSND